MNPLLARYANRAKIVFVGNPVQRIFLLGPNINILESFGDTQTCIHLTNLFVLLLYFRLSLDVKSIQGSFKNREHQPNLLQHGMPSCMYLKMLIQSLRKMF